MLVYINNNKYGYRWEFHIVCVVFSFRVSVHCLPGV